MPGATETNFFHRAGMDGTKLGRSKKDDQAQVAKEAYDALMAGKDKVITGAVKNKMFATGGRVIPDETKAELHRKEAEPGPDKK